MVRILLLLGAVVTGLVGFYTSTRARARAYYRHTGVSIPPVGVRGTVDRGLTEVAALVVLGWRAPALLWEDRRVVPPQAHGHPVLCIHGFMQNASNFVRIRRHLHQAGRITQGVNMGRPLRAPDAYADVVEARLDALVRDTEGPVDAVAHSMGGVVLRIVLTRRPDLARRMGRIVTVASPHAGTAAARGIPLPETRFMARRGPLVDLVPPLSTLAPQARITTIGSVDDFTVYPLETTRDPGARALEVRGFGHNSVLLHRLGEAMILDALCHDLPADTAPR